MLSLLDHGQTLCDGITRREWMRIGGIGLGGLTMPGLAAARAATPTSVAATAKRVILFGLTGGAPSTRPGTPSRRHRPTSGASLEPSLRLSPAWPSVN